MESVGAFLDGEWESICKLFTADEDQEPDYTMELLLSDHHQSLTSLSNLTTNQGANTIFDHHGIGVNCDNLNALNINSHINYFSHGNTCTTSTATTSSDHSGDGSAFLPTPTTTDNHHHHPGESYYGYDQSLAASSMAYCMMEQNVQNGGSNTMASGITSSIYDIQNMMDYEMMNPTNNEGCVSGNHIIHPVSNNDDDSPSAPSSTKDVGIEMEQKNTTSTTVPVPKKRGRVAKDGQKGKKKRKQSRATSSGEEEEENKNNMINGGGGPNKNNNNNSSSSDVQMNSDNESNVSDEINGEENENKVGAVKTRASRGAATDPQSLYARKRRERINERLRILQNLVPNGTKVDISTMLEEAVHYVKFLQLQIKLLSSDEMWMYAPLAYNGVDVSQYRKFSPFMI